MTDPTTSTARCVGEGRRPQKQFKQEAESWQNAASIINDPVVAVALAMAFAKICRQRGTEIPAPAIDLLRSHVDEGGAACMVVFAHLTARGLIPVVTPASLGVSPK